MIMFIKRLLGRQRPRSTTPTKTREYLYNVSLHDGTGQIVRTDDPEVAKLAQDGLYIREDGHVACITCGGNCGQCGRTARLGNIGLDLQRLVDRLHLDR